MNSSPVARTRTQTRERRYKRMAHTAATRRNRLTVGESSHGVALQLLSILPHRFLRVLCVFMCKYFVIVYKIIVLSNVINIFIQRDFIL